MKPWLATILFLTAPFSAWAEEVAVKATAPALEISGFIDLSVAADASNRSSGLGMTEIELDLKRSFGDIAAVRADLNFRYADALDTKGQYVAPSSERLVEQAFVTIDAAKKATGLSFTFGKFNAPIGFEALDAPDRFQLSLSNVFSYLAPFNLAGAMATWERGPVMLLVHVSRGWDQLVDNNSSTTFGGRFALTLAGGKATLGLSGLWGPEGARDGDARTVVDLDFTLRLWERLVWGVEVNYGTQPYGSTLAAGSRASWAGFLTAVHYKWTDWLGTTLRYDVVHDPDGAMVTPGVAQTRHALTAAALFRIAKGNAPFGVSRGAVAGVEYKGELSSSDVFERSDKTLGRVRHTLAANLLYAW